MGIANEWSIFVRMNYELFWNATDKSFQKYVELKRKLGINRMFGSAYMRLNVTAISSLHVI